MKRRLLSLFVSVVLVAGLCPMPAFAGEGLLQPTDLKAFDDPPDLSHSLDNAVISLPDYHSVVDLNVPPSDLRVLVTWYNHDCTEFRYLTAGQD